MASFSRKFKKIAGPGFHVNVRFDDAHVRLAKNGGQTVSIETLKLVYGLIQSEGYLWLERPDQPENEK